MQIGVAISAVGNQIVTTVLVTYAIDSHIEHSASIGVFVNLVRSTWGFIVPFWAPDMEASLGSTGSGGLMIGLVFAVSWIPIVILQWSKKHAGSRKSAAVGQAAVPTRQ